MSVRITGVRKDNGYHQNPHEAISHYKWVNEHTNADGISDRPVMVKWVEDGNRAYVTSAAGTVDCYVNKSATGTKFLQTDADGRSSNNLLNLPQC